MSTKSPITITGTAITDGTLGTASSALAEITASYVEATIANSLATLAAEINALIVDVTAIKAALDTSHTQITT